MSSLAVHSVGGCQFGSAAHGSSSPGSAGPVLRIITVRSEPGSGNVLLSFIGSTPRGAKAGHKIGVLFFALLFTGNGRNGSNAASQETGGNESGGFMASRAGNHAAQRETAADRGDRCR